MLEIPQIYNAEIRLRNWACCWASIAAMCAPETYFDASLSPRRTSGGDVNNGKYRGSLVLVSTLAPARGIARGAPICPKSFRTLHPSIVAFEFDCFVAINSLSFRWFLFSHHSPLCLFFLA